MARRQKRDLRGRISRNPLAILERISLHAPGSLLYPSSALLGEGHCRSVGAGGHFHRHLLAVVA